MVIKNFIEELENSMIGLTNDRKEQIKPLIDTIKSSLSSHQSATVQFICTHNSRRSQTAEFLLDILAREYGLNITALSAGTEATAFNPRMVTAITSYGFQLLEYGHDKNPLYIYSVEHDDLYYYSKRYDEELIPIGQRIIVTVCGDAEENCPIIPGTFKRLHLGYTDPKHSDGTASEADTYRAKVLEIGVEMLYLVKELAKVS